MTPRFDDLERHVETLERAALAAADPAAAVARALSASGDALVAGDVRIALARGARVWLIAAGKASPGLARAALAALGGRVAGGLVAHPHALDPGSDWPAGVRTVAAAHPLPDAGSLAAGEAALAVAGGAAADDVVLVLLSGGGSALLEALRPGVSLDDLRAITGALQRAGADIVELNTVRRALSRVKGGDLARAAAPARVLTLLLSDVLGDRLDAIASGPTVASSTGPADALAALERRGLAAAFPAAAAALRGAAPATPVAGDHVLVGSNHGAALAVAAAAESLGFTARVLTTYLQGEAREAGRIVGGLAWSVRTHATPAPAPCALILGGETTVTVRGEGRGGRNLEVALGAALALAGCPRAAVLTLATDGRDGASDAAGACVTGDTAARAGALGRSIHDALERNDSDPLLEALGARRVTGPTGTNVNDLAIALVYP